MLKIAHIQSRTGHWAELVMWSIIEIVTSTCIMPQCPSGDTMIKFEWINYYHIDHHAIAWMYMYIFPFYLWVDNLLKKKLCPASLILITCCAQEIQITPRIQRGTVEIQSYKGVSKILVASPLDDPFGGVNLYASSWVTCVHFVMWLSHFLTFG